MKTCSHCRKDKPAECFHKNSASPDGKYAQCKICVTARNAARRKKFPVEGRKYSRRHRKIFHALSIRQRRESRLRKAYGLEPEDFEQIRLNQQNRCAICKEEFSKTPYVDHCHQTGKVRGLLCHDCNTGIGLLKDSSWRLRDAASYLEKA